MFTVKATYLTGHTVCSCDSYEFLSEPDLEGFQTLILRDKERLPLWQMQIKGTVYVMNDAGRTVDTFHAYSGVSSTRRVPPVGESTTERVA